MTRLLYWHCVSIFPGDGRLPDGTMVFSLGKSTNWLEELQVTHAHLAIKLKYKKQSQKRNPRRRIELDVYSMPEGDQDERKKLIMPKGYQDERNLLSSLNVVLRHTKKQKLILPVTAIQSAMDTARELRIRLVCRKCNNVIFPVLFNGGKRVSGKPGERGVGVERSRRRHKRRDRPWKNRGACLVVRAKPKAPARGLYKRSITVSSGDRPCWTERLYVSFADMGWCDWVVYPHGFVANFCRGSCISSHAESSRISRPDQWSYQSSSQPTSTCQPTRSRPLSIVYRAANGSLARTEIQNLLVDRCDCVAENG